MPNSISGDGTLYPASFNVPADNDKRNAQSVNTGFQALANRTEFLRQHTMFSNGAVMVSGAKIVSPGPTPAMLSGVWATDNGYIEGTVIPPGYATLSLASQSIVAVYGGRYRCPNPAGAYTVTLMQGTAIPAQTPVIGARVEFVCPLYAGPATNNWMINEEGGTNLVQFFPPPSALGQIVVASAALEFGASGWKLVSATTMFWFDGSASYTFGAVPAVGGM